VAALEAADLLALGVDGGGRLALEARRNPQLLRRELPKAGNVTALHSDPAALGTVSAPLGMGYGSTLDPNIHA